MGATASGSDCASVGSVLVSANSGGQGVVQGGDGSGCIPNDASLAGTNCARLAMTSTAISAAAAFSPWSARHSVMIQAASRSRLVLTLRDISFLLRRDSARRTGNVSSSQPETRIDHDGRFEIWERGVLDSEVEARA